MREKIQSIDAEDYHAAVWPSIVRGDMVMQGSFDDNHLVLPNPEKYKRPADPIQEKPKPVDPLQGKFTIKKGKLYEGWVDPYLKREYRLGEVVPHPKDGQTSRIAHEDIGVQRLVPQRFIDYTRSRPVKR